ncbi:uncharacterized protein LOC108023976 [Drosophila biarmipes]|uniref:uncharacterized protein LOC108023976 n=1 Tax=Drosophila biarmipes TaxID=125945 RepID=UPI0007E7BAD6|nr:uncharacterized protein LOC108023976 [Drosophila biarmipes]
MLLVQVFTSSANNQNIKPTLFEISEYAKILELKQKLEPITAIPLYQIKIFTSDKSVTDKEVISDILREMSLKDPRADAAFNVFDNKTFVGFVRFHRQVLQNGKAVDSLYYVTPDSRSSSSSAVSGLPKKRALELENPAAGDSTMPVFSQTDRLGTDEGDGFKCESSSSMEEEQPSCSTGMAAPQCIDRTKDCCQQQNCGKPDNRPPYARTMPENRRYGLVVSNLDSCEEVDSEALMSHIFELFESCSIKALHFSDCISMAKFCSNLLIVCVDDETAEWVVNAVDTLCPPHSCMPFIKFFDLMRCTFVLPLVRPGEPLCSIFSLMEKQNPDLVTDKWSVVNRTPLDPCDDNGDLVTDLCPNELIELFIDEDSKDLITQQCSKIVYFCWHLKVNFEC